MRFFAAILLAAILSSTFGARSVLSGSGKPLGGCEQEFLRVVEGVRPSVVTVIAYSKIGGAEEKSERAAPKTLKKTVGSGVVINGEGHVLTTTSVIGSSRNLFIRTHDGRERAAVFLGADHETGLALLKVKAEGLAPAQLGHADDLQPGAWAIIVAESFGQYPGYAFGAFTGLTGGEPGSDRAPALLQMSTQVYPGNSGGAVANARGEVVGVVLGAMSAAALAGPEGEAGAQGAAGREAAPGEQGAAGGKATPIGESAGSGEAAPSPGAGAASTLPSGLADRLPDPQRQSVPVGPTLSLAIPIDRAGQVASDLAAHGSSWPGFIGVRVRTSTPALKDLLNFENGVVILEVLPMSPAEAAGIEAGDVILRFGGRTVREPSELARLVADVRPGERRDVELLRGDVHLTRVVTIGAAPIGGGDRQPPEVERQRLQRRVTELKRELEALEGRLQDR